jgi:hypothetical protein
MLKGCNSSVGILTDYGVDGRGSIPGKSKRFPSIPHRPDRLWDPPSLIFNRYWGLFPRGVKTGRNVKLITHLQQVLKSRMVELNISTPPYIFRV